MCRITWKSSRIPLPPSRSRASRTTCRRLAGVVHLGKSCDRVGASGTHSAAVDEHHTAQDDAASLCSPSLVRGLVAVDRERLAVSARAAGPGRDRAGAGPRRPVLFARPRFASSRLPHLWAAPPRGLRLTRVRHRRLLNVRFRTVPKLITALFPWCRVSRVVKASQPGSP
jgi:hypothetical protein